MSLPLADKRLRPRKEPRQSRGHETRARILDAARHVFATRGYSAGTTNRIADAAGLSVGSLYQYFPNKDAILVELVDLHLADSVERVTRAVDDSLARHQPELPALDDLIGSAVAAMVELHAADRHLHRVLFEEAPRPPELLDALHRAEADMVERVAALLDAHPEVDVSDAHVAGRMAVTTIESLVHRVVPDESSAITDAQLQTELTTLVTGYLRS